MNQNQEMNQDRFPLGDDRAADGTQNNTHDETIGAASGDALGALDDRYLTEAEEYRAPKRRRTVRWLMSAACFLLIAGALTVWIRPWQLPIMIPGIDPPGLATDRMTPEEPLPEQNLPVTSLPSAAFTRVESFSSSPGVVVRYNLVAMSEEEIFSKPGLVIFRGTITALEGYVIDFSPSDPDDRDSDKPVFSSPFNQSPFNQEAVAVINVEEVFQGNLAVGDHVRILLPAIPDAMMGSRSVWIEDTDLVRQFKEGMSGIFMPVPVGEGGSCFLYHNLAGYRFPDGVRWAFIETDDGLVQHVTSRKLKTLDDAEWYVKWMLFWQRFNPAPRK